MLLSSLPGAAVTSIKIEGAQHEFQDLPGIKEDVTDIVLNVKRIRLRSLSDHAVTMRLEVTGPRVVTAGDIQAPSTVEIVNPETPICTLDSEDARLEMDLIVETGQRLRTRRVEGRSTHWADSGGRDLHAGRDGSIISSRTRASGR